MDHEESVKHSPEAMGGGGDVYADLAQGAPAPETPGQEERAQIIAAAGERSDGKLREARAHLKLVESDPIGTPPERRHEWEHGMDAVDRAGAISADWADRQHRQLPEIYPVGGPEPQRPLPDRQPTAAEVFGKASTEDVTRLEEDFAAFASAPRRELAAAAREAKEPFMVETHDRDAARMEAAARLTARMVHDKFLDQEVEYKNHLKRPDQEQATLDVMAKAAVHHLRRAERAAAKGKHDKSKKHRERARNAMGEAASRADFGVDASSLVKKRGQFWK